MKELKKDCFIEKYSAFLIIIVFLIMGCSALSDQTNTSARQGEVPETQKSAPSYYDFGDVLIPSELKLDRKSSFVYQTAGLSAGVLVLKARVELNSLIKFFEVNMTKDNWRLLGSFKSPRTIMMFKKENRWCVINITATVYNTLVEIWVAPMTNESGSGLLKE